MTKRAVFCVGGFLSDKLLGLIYTRNAQVIDERQVYTLDDLQDIVSVIKDFEFLLYDSTEKTKSFNAKAQRCKENQMVGKDLLG